MVFSPQPTIDRAVPHQEIDRVVLQRQIKRVISRRQIKRALRFARPALAQELGGEAAAAVEGRLLEQYVAVAPAVPRLRSPMSRMTLRMAVDAVVLYRSLPADLASDQKLALISRFVANWMEGQFDTVMARWVYAHRIPHLLLRRWWFGRPTCWTSRRGGGSGSPRTVRACSTPLT